MKTHFASKFHSIDLPRLLRRILLSWVLAVAVEYALLPHGMRNLSHTVGLAQMSLLRIFGVGASVFLLFSFLRRFAPMDRIEPWGLVAGFGILSVLAMYASFSWLFLLACGLILLLLTVYALRGWHHVEDVSNVPAKPASPWQISFTVGMCLFFLVFTVTWSLCRIYSFSTPTYDFGLFSQMFYNMKASGQPLTTLERDTLLSHFAVHVSPIYYLMLPIYCLFPTPETLQILQTLVMVSAVLPLWKLCEAKGLSGTLRMLLCGMLLLFPAFVGGVKYDLHENCFLTVLLLWLFYGICKKQLLTVSLCTLLTLCVKEDAAVYVAVIGLWLFVKSALNGKKRNTRELLTGLALMIVSILWFLLVTGYLKKHGDGVMTYRYSNFMFGNDDSLFAVIKSVLLNPMKALYECAEREKLKYILLTLLPLLGLPLFTRRYERYILLIPYILVNLMSDYEFQHDVFYQYNFGSVAFLFYLTVVNVADLKSGKNRRLFLIPSAILCVLCFALVVVPEAAPYPKLVIRNHESYQSLRETLDLIPEDATVSASTYYNTYLSQRKILYNIHYVSRATLLETEYIVMDPTDAICYETYVIDEDEYGFSVFLRFLNKHGYKEYASRGDQLLIYKKETS